MAERLTFNTSQLGHSLSQISELTGLTIEEVKETLGQATGLTPKDVGVIFHMKQRGLSLEQITQESGVELEILLQFLPEVTFENHALADRSPYTTNEETKETPQPTETLPRPHHCHIPTFYYCCQEDTNKLLRVNLLTGEETCHRVPSYQFKYYCRWSELPGGNLLITGGGSPAVKDAERIDTLREWAVSSLPLMHAAILHHAAVYHSQHLYVLGGHNSSALRECERYVCAESRWEVLPALPEAGSGMSAVELGNSLYALGGYSHPRSLDTVQKLSVDSLTWELMQLKLPQAECIVPCFKTDTQVYLVIEKDPVQLHSPPIQANQDASSKHKVLLELLQQRHSTLRQWCEYLQLSCRGIN
jgi:hypothetical protein